jgi:hypothetical protein
MEQIIFETLAGRIRYERTSSGIRVEIPTRKDLSAILAVSVIEIWALRGLFLIPERFFINGQPSTGQWAALGGFLSVGALGMIWLLWNLVGKSRLDLDSVELKIVRRFMGFKLDTRSFRTREIRNMRYLPYSEFRVFKGFIPGVFCFEAEGKTHRFGSGVTDIEAFALIDEMLAIYEFPKDRAVEYIGARR